MIETKKTEETPRDFVKITDIEILSYAGGGYCLQINSLPGPLFDTIGQGLEWLSKRIDNNYYIGG